MNIYALAVCEQNTVKNYIFKAILVMLAHLLIIGKSNKNNKNKNKKCHIKGCSPLLFAFNLIGLIKQSTGI